MGNSLPIREYRDFLPANAEDTISTLSMRAVTIYCCYHNNKRDKVLWERLARHFAVVKRLERVVIYDCYDILPGSSQEHECNARLAAASIVLLLLSADFAHDNFC